VQRHAHVGQHIGHAPYDSADGPNSSADRRDPYRATRPPRWPRCSRTDRMAIEPSPTAEATRLTERLRTSPTANTPGRLVSTRDGSRARFLHPGAFGASH